MNCMTKIYSIQNSDKNIYNTKQKNATVARYIQCIQQETENVKKRATGSITLALVSETDLQQGTHKHRTHMFCKAQSFICTAH